MKCLVLLSVFLGHCLQKFRELRVGLLWFFSYCPLPIPWLTDSHLSSSLRTSRQELSEAPEWTAQSFLPLKDAKRPSSNHALVPTTSHLSFFRPLTLVLGGRLQGGKGRAGAKGTGGLREEN